MARCFISRPSLTKNAFAGAAYTTKAYGMHPLCHPLEVLAKSANLTFASQKNVRNGLSPEQCYEAAVPHTRETLRTDVSDAVFNCSLSSRVVRDFMRFRSTQAVSAPSSARYSRTPASTSHGSCSCI